MLKILSEINFGVVNITQIIFHPTNHNLMAFTEGNTGQVWMWDNQKQRETISINPHIFSPNEYYSYDATQVRWSPNMDMLIVNDWWNEEVSIWDAVSGELLLFLPSKQEYAGFTQDQTMLVTTNLGTMTYWVIPNE